MADYQQIIPVNGFLAGDDYTAVKLNQTTPFTLRTIPINHRCTGMATVSCVAIDGVGDSMTREKKFRFKKDDSGILTIDSSTTYNPPQNSSMSGCDFIITSIDEQIAIRVQGATGTAKPIWWQIAVTDYNIFTFDQF
jgi:hypothetical protein